MKRIELKKVSIVFLTMLLFLSIQIPAFAADTDTTVKIPVEQVFDSKNTDVSDEFMYALLTDQSDAPMPDGSSNRRYVWNMKGNIATAKVLIVTIIVIFIGLMIAVIYSIRDRKRRKVR